MSDHSCPGAATDLRQCTEFEYILLGDLRDLLEDPPSDENRKWLVAVLDALIDTLPKEFALKSRDYPSEVVRRSSKAECQLYEPNRVSARPTRSRPRA